MFETYNAATDLLWRNLPERVGKTAFIDDRQSITFGALAEQVDRFAGHLIALGISQEMRLLIALEDSIAFPIACLGAIRAGVVPVMVNTLLTTDDYTYLLADSRAVAAVISPSVLPAMGPVLRATPKLRQAIVTGPCGEGLVSLDSILANATPIAEPAATRADEPCLWQYSSGSTGRPKATIHSHGAIERMVSLYPRQVIGIGPNDVTFSAAKLFFGYGFGNGLAFPLAAGATAVLMAERPTPAAVAERLRRHRPTIFYGVPTLYNSLLGSAELPRPDELALRICTSAGEALPPEVGLRWRERFGIDILDGIGSTEMLHIFLSNRPGDVRYGTTGRPVDGFELRLLDEAGQPVPPGEVGELHISGPTSAIGYWNNRQKTRATFVGAWVRSGDKFRQEEDGRYVYCGRSDDMLKVSGIYVSPFEVESALLTHPDVAEAAVVGWRDEAGLIKPKAFVVLRPGVAAGKNTAEALKAHAKVCLAPYKYPRWFEFVDALPKTASGKIQRFELRALQSVKSAIEE